MPPVAVARRFALRDPATRSVPSAATAEPFANDTATAPGPRFVNVASPTSFTTMELVVPATDAVRSPGRTMRPAPTSVAPLPANVIEAGRTESRTSTNASAGNTASAPSCHATGLFPASSQFASFHRAPRAPFHTSVSACADNTMPPAIPIAARHTKRFRFIFTFL